MNLRTTTLAEPRTTHSAFRTPRSALRASPAFTLVEILVTVSLLAFIVLGLFAVFNQVQRAFRSSMNQVDRLEAGRAITGMLPRELEQTTPCAANAVTFVAQVIPTSAPLIQSLPGTTVKRLNLLEDCFFLQRQNQAWIGIGYCVRTNDSKGQLWLPESGPGQLGVGSLYRFMATKSVIYYNPNNPRDPNNGLPTDPGQLYAQFKAAALVGSAAISNRICDGVIHFYLTAFATNGFPIVSDNNHTNAYFRANPSALPAFYTSAHPAKVDSNVAYPGNVAALYFWSNAVPAAVELQFGMLEQHALDRYNSISDPNARLAYLQRDDNTSRVHIFRQRIPIRNVDPVAYQ